MKKPPLSTFNYGRDTFYGGPEVALPKANQADVQTNPDVVRGEFFGGLQFV